VIPFSILIKAFAPFLFSISLSSMIIFLFINHIGCPLLFTVFKVSVCVCTPAMVCRFFHNPPPIFLLLYIHNIYFFNFVFFGIFFVYQGAKDKASCGTNRSRGSFHQ
jgi:hypothetical protein